MINFKQFFDGIRIKAKAVLNSDTKGELEVSDSTGKLQYHNGSSRSPVVTEAHTATLTNKTIDANGTGNSISNLETADLAAGVLNTSTTLSGASDTQVPSALAVKTYVDNNVGDVVTDVADLVTLSGVPANSTDLGTFTGTTIPDNSDNKEAFQALETSLEAHINDTVDAHDASAISNIPSGNLVATDVQAALNELQTDVDTRATSAALTAHTGASSGVHGVTGSVVGTTDSQTLTNKTIDADLNTISNIDNADIKAAANIQRTKLASANLNTFVGNDGSGVMTDVTNMTHSANAVTLSNLKHLELQAATDSTTTGSNASLVSVVAGGVRLTNASLVSVANIPAGANGQEFILFNRTGATVTIKDASAALGTAADRILTGSGTDLVMTPNAAVILSYDNTTARWQVVGGSGGGSTTFLDTTFAINDATDQTKQITFDAGGTTATKTTITAAQTANRVITLPDATTTVVGTDTTQTLTNKTIVAANNTITTAASGNLSSTALNSALAELQGDINLLNTNPNYILNNEFSVDVSGWATYADAAGSSPVDGTGGSPNVTFTRTTSTPIFGLGSGLLTKDAVNRQGQGFSYDFTIDEGMKTKVTSIRFDYQIASGTYATGDLSVWIYDVTNGVLIQPAPYQIQNSSIMETFIAEFQATTSASYRLIVHVSTTSTSAYTVKFDNFYVGRAPKVYGSVVTDPIFYTPTFVGFGTISNSYFTYARQGKYLYVEGRFSTGTPTAVTASMSLPNNYNIDNSNLPVTRNVGRCERNVISQQGNDWSIIAQSSGGNTVNFSLVNSGGAAPTTALLGTDLAGSGETVSLRFKVPIQGWSTSQQLSDSADTRVVAFTGTGTPANVTANNPIIYPTISKDTHGAYNTTTGKYTIPVPGFYRIAVAGALTSGTSARLYLYINNSIDKIMGQIVSASGLYNGYIESYLTAGQIIDVRPDSSVTGFAGTGSISISLISGPAQIAASESVSASYWLSANFASSSTTPVNFDSKEFDSHNAVTVSATAWRFTAPVSGTYLVFVKAYSNGAIDHTLYKNGFAYKVIAPEFSTSDIPNGMALVRLLAGEYLDVRSATGSTVRGGALTAASTARFEITKTGNY